MKENFDCSFAFVLGSEGGFSDNPADPGGMTNLGVTKRSWEAFVGHEVSEAEMSALTSKGVTDFYHQGYWDLADCDQMPAGVDYMLFDFAVNAGVKPAIKVMQKAVGAVPDGSIGIRTLAAISSCPEPLNAFSDAKKEYYRSLKNFPIFGKGWLKRVDEVLVNAQSFTTAS